MIITARQPLTTLFVLAVLALGPGFSLTLSPAVACANEELARERFQEGRQLFQDENYVEAAEKFLEAYELSGRSALLYNVGQAYRRADLLPESEEYFQQYLNEQPDAANADEVVETIIEIQREQASRIASVQIDTRPSSASVFVDDEPDPRCISPCSLDLAPGTYTLRAELDGYLPASTSISAEARQELNTSLDLQQATTMGSVKLLADVNGAFMELGGRSYPVPSPMPIEIEAGRYLLTVSHRSQVWTQEIDVPANETLHVFASLDSTGNHLSPLRIGAFSLAGTGLGLAIAAAIMGSQARSTHGLLESQQTLSGHVDPDLLETGRSQKTMANFLWVGSVVGLASGAGLFTFDLFGTSSRETIPPSSEPDQPIERL